MEPSYAKLYDSLALPGMDLESLRLPMECREALVNTCTQITALDRKGMISTSNLKFISSIINFIVQQTAHHHNDILTVRYGVFQPYQLVALQRTRPTTAVEAPGRPNLDLLQEL